VSTSFVASFGCIAQPKRRLEGALFDTNLGAPGKLATSKLATGKLATSKLATSKLATSKLAKDM